MRKNRSFWFLLIIYFILFVADLTTTLLNGELAQHLEINPLFLMTQSWWLIIAINFAVMIVMIYCYLKSRSPLTRYVIINQMVIIIFLRIFAIRNALYWIRNPISVETAVQTYTEAVKVAAAVQLSWMIYMPIVLSIVTFVFWKWDHHVKIK